MKCDRSVWNHLRVFPEEGNPVTTTNGMAFRRNGREKAVAWDETPQMRPKGPANDHKAGRTSQNRFTCKYASSHSCPRSLRSLSLLFSTAAKVHLQRCFKCLDVYLLLIRPHYTFFVVHSKTQACFFFGRTKKGKNGIKMSRY